MVVVAHELALGFLGDGTQIDQVIVTMFVVALHGTLLLICRENSRQSKASEVKLFTDLNISGQNDGISASLQKEGIGNSGNSNFYELSYCIMD